MVEWVNSRLVFCKSNNMCLLSFAWQPDTDTPLTLVSNRDEFHKRATAPSDFWEDHPELLAGKDLEAGGTWMGVTRHGRFAALTNVRQLPSPYQGQVSRGALVKDYLVGRITPEHYLKQIVTSDYDGFNLIVGDRTQCWYLGNRPLDSKPKQLHAGLYGLSNAQLNTPWPKTEQAKNTLKDWLKQKPTAQRPLYGLLHSQSKYDTLLLPKTGIGEEWESLLSSPFIVSPEYGTRACTGLLIRRGTIHWQESTISPEGLEILQKQYSF
jgi:uncharacterized protein with NRDE domain